MTEFTFTTTFDPQFRDIDPFGHVNQAVYLSYLEQARTKYWEEVVGLRHDRTPVALVEQTIQYTKPILLDDTVTVAQNVAGMGRSSFELEYEVRTDEGVAATAEVVLIAYDPESEAATPIPEEWREPIAEWEGIDGP